ncbi:desulfoferrodoxin family protein [Fusobacterium sp.]|uniref:desulfoferrodoxin family protein n=1 Tax=Fusobacterium sp. TaxID=68766 RepID=UPI00396C439C
MKKNEFAKLGCGAIAQILIPGEQCADTKLEVIEPKTQDAATEKHVPYVEEKADGYLVKVGKDAKHPMLEAHYIQFIEIEVDGDMLYRKYLKPGEEPEAYFRVPKGKNVVAREYCNLHGLWEYK